MLRRPTDQELVATIHEIFAQKMPFNLLLGLDVLSLTDDIPVCRIAMRPDLVGNFLHGNLHGGVISSVIDSTGGLSAFLSIRSKLAGETVEVCQKRFARIATIDLRVDYLRPGLGSWFECKAYLLRAGNKVAVVRMELHNDEAELIAVGTGAYSVG